MAEFLTAIDRHREAILLGEIGALLHMFGKCSSEFLRANSLENEGRSGREKVRDTHQSLEHLPNLTPNLQAVSLHDTFTFILNSQDSQAEKLSGDFTDFIVKYKRCEECHGINLTQCKRCKGKSPDSQLIWLFNSCHRMTSADEKGVVRKKQSETDIRITTPFGHPTHPIDLSCIDEQRKEMDRQLAEAFEEYLSKKSVIEDLRRRATAILKPGLS